MKSKHFLESEWEWDITKVFRDKRMTKERCATNRRVPQLRGAEKEKVVNKKNQVLSNIIFREDSIGSRSESCQCMKTSTRASAFST